MVTFGSKGFEKSFLSHFLNSQRLLSKPPNPDCGYAPATPHIYRDQTTMSNSAQNAESEYLEDENTKFFKLNSWLKAGKEAERREMKTNPQICGQGPTLICGWECREKGNATGAACLWFMSCKTNTFIILLYDGKTTLIPHLL